MIICNVNQTISDVVSLKKSIIDDKEIISHVKNDIILRIFKPKRTGW